MVEPDPDRLLIIEFRAEIWDVTEEQLLIRRDERENALLLRQRVAELDEDVRIPGAVMWDDDEDQVRPVDTVFDQVGDRLARRLGVLEREGIEAADLERLAELARIDRRRRGDENAALLGPRVAAVGKRQLENSTLVIGRERVPELPSGGGPLGLGLALDVVGDKPTEPSRNKLDVLTSDLPKKSRTTVRYTSKLFLDGSYAPRPLSSDPCRPPLRPGRRWHPMSGGSRRPCISHPSEHPQ